MNGKFACKECGFESPKWMGLCTSCDSWDTFEAIVQDRGASGKKVKILKIDKVETDEERKRLSSGFAELDRTLGGGFVDGQVILIGGEPGVGKTTLLLQTVNQISSQKVKSLYASAEESVGQVSHHFKRLGFSSTIDIVSANDIDSILETVKDRKYKFLIIDSIQTIKSDEIRGVSGAVSQVKECTSRIVEFAKRNNVTTVLVGHITKEGNLAGPKVIEHLVDGVFYLESDKSNKIKILRSIKNRFGPTSEIGVFHFEKNGFSDAKNPSEMFVLSDKPSIGICKGIVFEGRRAMVLEIQSLISKSGFSVAQRVVNGLKRSKIQMFCALLSKYSKASFYEKDVYVNVANGFKISDSSMDLSVCVSLLSSYYNKKVDSRLLAIGEVSLTGKIHAPSLLTERLKAASRLGYKKIVLPQETKSHKNIPKETAFLDSVSDIKKVL